MMKLQQTGSVVDIKVHQTKKKKFNVLFMASKSSTETLDIQQCGEYELDGKQQLSHFVFAAARFFTLPAPVATAPAHNAAPEMFTVSVKHLPMPLEKDVPLRDTNKQLLPLPSPVDLVPVFSCSHRHSCAAVASGCDTVSHITMWLLLIFTLIIKRALEMTLKLQNLGTVMSRRVDKWLHCLVQTNFLFYANYMRWLFVQQIKHLFYVLCVLFFVWIN